MIRCLAIAVTMASLRQLDSADATDWPQWRSAFVCAAVKLHRPP
jgi:hypothetical protein